MKEKRERGKFWEYKRKLTMPNKKQTCGLRYICEFGGDAEVERRRPI